MIGDVHSVTVDTPDPHPRSPRLALGSKNAALIAANIETLDRKRPRQNPGPSTGHKGVGRNSPAEMISLSQADE
jgi:hypothetical protein